MKLVRILFFSFFILVLLVLGVIVAGGFYLHRNADAVIADQLQLALKAQGVTKVSIDGPELSRHRASVNAITVAGVREGHQFSARLDTLSADFSWLSWRHIQWERITLGEATIELTPLSVPVFPSRMPTTADAPHTLELSELLPHNLLAKLPSPTPKITLKQWTINYHLPLPPQTGTIDETADNSSQLTTTQSSRHTVLRAQGTLAIDASVKLTLNIDALGGQLESHWQAEKDAPLDGDIAFTLDGKSATTLTASLLSTEKRWHWKLNGEVTPQPLLQWLTTTNLDGHLATLTGSRAFSIEEALAPVTALELDGHASLDAELTHPETLTLPLNTAAELSNMLTADGALAISINQLTLPAEAIGHPTKVSGKTQLTLHHDRALSRVHWDATHIDLRVPAQALPLNSELQRTLGWSGDQPLRITQNETAGSSSIQRVANSGDPDLEGAPNALVWRSDQQQWVANLQAWECKLGTRRSNIRVDIQALRAWSHPYSLPSVAFEGQSHLRLRNSRLPSLNLNLKALATAADKHRIEGDIRDLAESFTLAGTGQMQLTTGDGRLATTLRVSDLPHAYNALVPVLKAFDLAEELPTIASGSLSLSSDIHVSSFGSEQLDLASQIALQSVSGALGDYAISGVNASTAWRGLKEWQTTQDIHIDIEELQVGIPIRDLTLIAALPAPTAITAPAVKLKRVEAHLLGGTASLSEPVAWDLARKRNALSLQANDWQLGQLVALQQDDSIAAQGRLEGELPLVVEDGRIIIENGFLRALPPGGTINYQPPNGSSVAASNEELAMALSLLEDFRFRVLSTDVDIDNSGQLTLKLALSGSNPQQFEGRQVNFNVNLEQNLDPLLQSMRMSDTLVKQLEQKLRK